MEDISCSVIEIEHEKSYLQFQFLSILLIPFLFVISLLAITFFVTIGIRAILGLAKMADSTTTVSLQKLQSSNDEISKKLTEVLETIRNILIPNEVSVDPAQISINSPPLQQTTPGLLPLPSVSTKPISQNTLIAPHIQLETTALPLTTTQIHETIPTTMHRPSPTIPDYRVPFSGGAPYEFIQGYEEFFKVNPMTEVDMIQYVMQDFEGEALEWYFEYVEEFFLDTWTLDCWEDFVVELYGRFAGEHKIFVEKTETKIEKVSESKFVGIEPSEMVMPEVVKNIEQQILREKYDEEEFNFLQTMVEYVNLHQVLRYDFDIWNYRLSNHLYFGFDPGDLSQLIKFMGLNSYDLTNIIQTDFTHSKGSIRSCGIKVLDDYCLGECDTTKINGPMAKEEVMAMRLTAGQNDGWPCRRQTDFIFYASDGIQQSFEMLEADDVFISGLILPLNESFRKEKESSIRCEGFGRIEAWAISGYEDGAPTIWVSTDMIDYDCVKTFASYKKLYEQFFAKASACIEAYKKLSKYFVGNLDLSIDELQDGVVYWGDLHHYGLKSSVLVYEAVEAVCVIDSLSHFASCLVSSIQQCEKKRSGPGIYFITVGERGIVRIKDSNDFVCCCEQKSSAFAVSMEAEDMKRGFTSAAMLPSGQGLLFVTTDQEFHFYFPTESPESCLKLILSKRFVGYNEEIGDVKILDKDVQFLVVAASVEQVRVYDLTSMSCSDVLAGHTDIILSLDTYVSTSGKTLIVTRSKDNNDRSWETNNRYCTGVGTGYMSDVGAVAFSKKLRSFFVSGSSEFTLKVWSFDGLSNDVEGASNLKAKVVVAVHSKDINSIAIAPNDSLVCSCSQDHTACMLRLPDLVSVILLRVHKRGIWSVEFSPVDQCIITTSGGKTIKIWAIFDGSCLKSFEGHTSSVLRASFLNHGTQFVSCGADGLLKLGTVKTNKCVATYDQYEDKVWAMAVEKKTEMLVIGSLAEPAQMPRDIDLSPGQSLQSNQSSGNLSVIGRRSVSDLGAMGDSLGGPTVNSGKRGHQPATMVLVQWPHSIPEDATWEEWGKLSNQYPNFNPWGQGSSQAVGNCQEREQGSKPTDLAVEGHRGL